MPAQDIHIVTNPVNDDLSPWFIADDTKEIITPEWRFFPYQLKRWWKIKFEIDVWLNGWDNL